MNLTPTSLISNNASLRAFDLDGLLYSPKPIEQLIKINFHNLVENQLYKFELTSKVNYDLKLVHFYLNDTSANVQIDKLEEETIVNSFTLQVLPTKIIYILESTQTYQIKSDKALSRLTLFCEPIHLIDSIDFAFPTTTTNTSTQGNEATTNPVTVDPNTILFP